MSRPLIDIKGQVFGHLTVIEHTGKGFWNCLCSCGKAKRVNGHELRKGSARSCGCKGSKHGHSKSGRGRTRVYVQWGDMVQRCANPNHPSFRNYGGRGIRVCERWLKFENFLKDMGEGGKGLSLDRIDNDGDYCVENCRWATIHEQVRNKRNNRFFTIGDRTQCLQDWCREYDKKSGTVRNRLKHGWTIEDALSKPLLPVGGWRKNKKR